MKNIREAIGNELRQGAKTIIAVGNDKTINQIINTMMEYRDSQAGINVPLGIIPIGEKNNLIAETLGIKKEEEACDTLSARRIKKLRIAQAQRFDSGDQISNNYFLSIASITSKGTILEINKKYSIEIMEPGEINVINLSTLKEIPDNITSGPQDEILELYIKTKSHKGILGSKKKSQSFFSLRKLTILNQKYPVILDNEIEVKTPVEISISEKKLDVIVGKERTF